MSLTKYEKAILDTIAYAEGTLGVSQNGYDVLVGTNKIINQWSQDTDIRHKCVKPTSDLTESKIKQKGFTLCEDDSWFLDTKNSKGERITSSAAGRYQFLGSTWATRTETLGLGFNAPMTAENQNLVGIALVKKNRNVSETELKDAYSNLNTFKNILKKMENEWTSLKLNEGDSKTGKNPEAYWGVYKYAVKAYS